MHDLTRDLPTPALSLLLSRGHLIHSNGDINAWLRNAFGLAHNPALAPLRLLGLTGESSAKRCLCIDPVNFSFVDRTVTVGKPEALQLTKDQAKALGEALAPVLHDIGDLEITTPALWHLHVHESAAELPSFMPLADFIGRRAEQGLPADPMWRHLINETQIMLHAHPVNQEREERGLPRINSIWPWGGGRLATDAKTEHDTVFSDNPVVQGLAKLCRLEVKAPPQAWVSLPHRHPLIAVDCLASLRSQGDGLRWRDALARLESTWFVPLQRALHGGRLNGLKIILPDVNGDSQLAISRRSMLKFWRRPAPLTILTT